MPPKMIDVIDILCNRNEILGALAGDSLSQQQLINQTDVSQSTVSRVLSKCQDYGLVSEIDNQYEFTLLGTNIYKKYEECVFEFEQLYSAQEILQNLPPNLSLPTSLLNGAEITISKPQAPDAAISPLLQLTREATHIKQVATMFYAGYMETLDNQLASGNLEAEFLVTDTVAKQSVKKYPDYDAMPLQDGHLEMYKTNMTAPYSLFLAKKPDENCTAVVVSMKSGAYGTIINRNEGVYKWASDQYEQFKSESTPWRPFNSDHSSDMTP